MISTNNVNFKRKLYLSPRDNLKAKKKERIGRGTEARQNKMEKRSEGSECEWKDQRSSRSASVQRFDPA